MTQKQPSLFEAEYTLQPPAAVPKRDVLLATGIEPGRGNWKQFCEELQVMPSEWRRWREVCAVLREDEAMAEAVEEKTRPYLKAMEDVGARQYNRNKDWSDLVEFADARRRWMRATVAAFEEVTGAS